MGITDRGKVCEEIIDNILADIRLTKEADAIYKLTLAVEKLCYLEATSNWGKKS